MWKRGIGTADAISKTPQSIVWLKLTKLRSRLVSQLNQRRKILKCACLPSREKLLTKGAEITSVCQKISIVNCNKALV